MRTHSTKYLERLKARNKGDRKSYHAWLVSTGQTQCHYCGRECGNAVTADHKKPLSKGGYDKRANILPACARCNSDKGDTLYEEFIAARNIQRR